MANEPVHKVIQQLRAELTRIDQLIHLLEGFAAGKPRRGRPPGILAGLTKPAPKKRKKTAK